MAEGKIVVVGFALVLDNFHVAFGFHTAAGHEMYCEKERDHLYAGNSHGAKSLQTGRVFGDRLHQRRHE